VLDNKLFVIKLIKTTTRIEMERKRVLYYTLHTQKKIHFYYSMSLICRNMEWVNH